MGYWTPTSVEPKVYDDDDDNLTAKNQGSLSTF